MKVRETTIVATLPGALSVGGTYMNIFGCLEMNAIFEEPVPEIHYRNCIELSKSSRNCGFIITFAN